MPAVSQIDGKQSQNADHDEGKQDNQSDDPNGFIVSTRVKRDFRILRDWLTARGAVLRRRVGNRNIDAALGTDNSIANAHVYILNLSEDLGKGIHIKFEGKCLHF